MEYRNHRNRKGQTGLQYSQPHKTSKPSTVSEKSEPAVVNGMARYMLVQTIAATIILVVITGIRLMSGDLHQSIRSGMNGDGVAGTDISNAAQQVVSYMKESETFSQLFPTTATATDQGDGAVWTSDVLSDDKYNALSDVKLTCPIEYTQITSAFGYRDDPFSGERSFHKGLDMAAPKGTCVIAAEDGIVSVCEYDEVGGWYIVMDHAGQLQTYYGHLSEIFVKKGDSVSARQMIALSGNSGKTTGPHLHFEVVDHGQNVDPAGYIHV